MSGSMEGAQGTGPLHVVQLCADGGFGTAAHVRSLAAGLVARGVRVTIGAPAAAGRRHAMPDTGAGFVALPPGPVTGSLRLTRALCAGADLVHAHGLRAGLAAALALRGRRVPLVMSWHRASSVTRCPQLRQLAERWVLRSAAVVLGAGWDLVDRARHRGARDVRLAPVALPVPRPATDPQERATEAQKIRAELGVFDRPLLVAAGPLTLSRGHGTLLSAAQGWQDRTPQPLLAIAGEGPQRGRLEGRIERDGLPVTLLGQRDDLPQLLSAADIIVHAAEEEDGRALLARGALSSGVPLVATEVAGMLELTGDDAAVLVPPDDPAALAVAVTDLLDAPERCAELAAAGPRRAAAWPTEDSTVAHILSVYDEFT